MHAVPHSIDEWIELASGDPSLAARSFIEKVNTISEKTRSRVFAALPSVEDLADSFQSASQQAGKPFAGVPFLLKDLFDFPGYPTTASSSFLAEVRPDPHEESLLSKAIRAQGAVFAGKTHLNEFAYGLSGENKTFGDCPHPVFPDRLSGGSSSGSAWAVRSGVVPLATGTDTGGSIRVPAAWCGVYGIRLSPNLWSTQGCFPLAASFDTAGWFCASTEDMATSIKALLNPPRIKSSALRGVCLLDSVPNLSPEFRAKAYDLLEDLNAHEEPYVSDAYRVATHSVAFHYSILQSIDALETHRSWIDEYKDRYDPVVWQRIERARHWTPEQIAKAKQTESAVQAFFASCFRKYDYVVLPATQSPAISASAHTDEFRNTLLGLTAPGSFARCPVLTVPLQLKSGESMGLQILYKSEESDLPLRILDRIRLR